MTNLGSGLGGGAIARLLSLLSAVTEVSAVLSTPSLMNRGASLMAIGERDVPTFFVAQCGGGICVVSVGRSSLGLSCGGQCQGRFSGFFQPITPKRDAFHRRAEQRLGFVRSLYCQPLLQS